MTSATIRLKLLASTGPVLLLSMTLLVHHMEGRRRRAEHDAAVEQLAQVEEARTATMAEVAVSISSLSTHYEDLRRDVAVWTQATDQLAVRIGALHMVDPQVIQPALTRYRQALSEQGDRIEAMIRGRLGQQKDIVVISRLPAAMSEIFGTLHDGDPEWKRSLQDLEGVSLQYSITNDQTLATRMRNSWKMVGDNLDFFPAGSRLVLGEIAKSMQSLVANQVMERRIIDDLFRLRIGMYERHLVQMVERAFREATVREERIDWILYGLIAIVICLALGSLMLQGQANRKLASLVELKTRDLEIQQRTVAEQQAIMAASAKLSSLGEMAGGIAHEIKNPLAMIYGRARNLIRLLEKSPDKTDQIRVFAADIAKNCDRIEKIVNGLSTFSRDGSNDPMEAHALERILDDSLDLCRERLRSDGIALRQGNIMAGHLVECQAVQIAQVIVNLINNAVDAVQQLPDKWIELELREGPGIVALAITDSGAGIAQAILEKIMIPFFTTKPIGKGTGIGLSISKFIIEKHGGRLYYDRTSPNTKFVIELPKADIKPVQNTNGLKKTA